MGLSKFAGPGGFNDPDMLEVGIISHCLFLHVSLLCCKSTDEAQTVNMTALCTMRRSATQA